MISERPVFSPKTSVDWPVLSVFSGAGGLDLGFQSAGFRSAIAIDINPVAIATYRRNHPETKAIQLDCGFSCVSIPPTHTHTHL